MYFCTHWEAQIPVFRGRHASEVAEYWETVADYWDAVEIGSYPKAFEAARKCDYYELAQLIPKLCLVEVRVLSLAMPCLMYCTEAVGPSRQRGLRHTAPCCHCTCCARVSCDCSCNVARGFRRSTRASFAHRSLEHQGPNNSATDSTAGTRRVRSLRKMPEAFCSGRRVQGLPTGGVLLCCLPDQRAKGFHQEEESRLSEKEIRTGSAAELGAA